MSRDGQDYRTFAFVGLALVYLGSRGARADPDDPDDPDPPDDPDDPDPDPPVARFEIFGPSNPTTEDTITLDASSSTGDIVQYRWLTDDEELFGEVVEHVYSEPGTHWVSLQVDDSAGQRDFAAEQITISEPDPPDDPDDPEDVWTAGKSIPDYPSPADGPRAWVANRDRPETVEISIRSSNAVLSKYGRVPEYRHAYAVALAFNEAGLGARVTYNLSPEPDPYNDASCPQASTTTTSYEWWRDRARSGNSSHIRKDSNILIVDSGGGCAGIGGNIGVVGARGSDPNYNFPWIGTSSSHDGMHWDIWAHLHEIGHNLGLRHDENPNSGFMEYAAIAWIDEFDRYQLTPNRRWADNDTHRNVCGESIPSIGGRRQWFAHYYSDCAVGRFQIQSGVTVPPDDPLDETNAPVCDGDALCDCF